MRLLVLGGTGFLSREVAAAAVAAGHAVTCVARGASGEAPHGATLVRVDRTAPDWTPLAGEWDAVVEVSSTPSWVSAALDELAGRAPHWVYVSSISVYADHTTPHGTPETLPALAPLWEEDVEPTPQSYGGHKAACEQLVTERAESALVVRPGLIVGPGDPTGRFSYWPDRLSEGGDVLAPDSPERDVQVIDVRDLAAWLVRCAEQRRTGVLDAAGWVTAIGEVLEEVRRGVDGDAHLYWAHPGFLRRHQVEPWGGPRSLPLWVPEEELGGMLRHDVSAAFAAGLVTRPVAETAADTLAWLRTPAGRGQVTGLARAEEQEILDDWHTI